MNSRKTIGLTLAISFGFLGAYDNSNEGSVQATEKVLVQSKGSREAIFENLKKLVEFSESTNVLSSPAAEVSHREVSVGSARLARLYLIGERIWLHDCTLTSERYWDAQNSAHSYKKRPTSEQHVAVFTTNVDLRLVDAKKTNSLEESRLVMIRGQTLSETETWGKGWQTIEDIQVAIIRNNNPTQPYYRPLKVDNNMPFGPKTEKKRSTNFKLGWGYPEDQPEIREAFGKLVSSCQTQEILDDSQTRIRAEKAESSKRTDRASFLVGLFKEVCLISPESIETKINAMKNDSHYRVVEPALDSPSSRSSMLETDKLGTTFKVFLKDNSKGKNECMVRAGGRLKNKKAMFDFESLHKAAESLGPTTLLQHGQDYPVSNVRYKTNVGGALLEYYTDPLTYYVALKIQR